MTKDSHEGSRQGSPGIQVITRAAAILRALGPEPMSLGAIARETALPRSTVQRIVDALAAEQLVEAGDRGVRPGWGLQRLATSSEAGVVAAMHPHLEWLFEQTRETVDFSMGQGREVVFLDRIISDQTLRVVPLLDRPRALNVMANGKAMLSTMSDDAIAKLFAHGARSNLPALDLRALMTELQEVRRTGFAYDRGGHADGVHAVGIPVQVQGMRPYALSIAAPSCRFDANLAMFKSALRKCRQACEAQLAGLG
jgi:IclR family transcriptional regulator, acetate operon repressor